MTATLFRDLRSGRTRMAQRVRAFQAGGPVSANWRILLNAGSIGILTLVVHTVTLARDLFIANRFGAGDVLDAYLIAFSIPVFVTEVCVGSFILALIPALIHARTAGGLASVRRMLEGVLFVVVAGLTAFGVTVLLAESKLLPIIAPGFGPDKLRLTSQLLHVMIPVMVFGGISTVGGAVLNTGNSFKTAALAPVLVPLCSTIGLVMAPAGRTAYWLAAGTLCGFLAHTAVIGLALRRTQHAVLPRWSSVSAVGSRFWSQALVMLVGGALLYAPPYIDLSMASSLGPGSVSAINYGRKIVTILVALTATPLCTAALPVFSRMAAESDWSGLKHTFSTYTRLIFSAAVPVVAVLMYFSVPVVRTLFQRGAFNADATALVASVQALYLLQLPFYIVACVGGRLLNSLRQHNVYLRIGVAAVVADVLFNWIFIRLVGVSGIGLSKLVVSLIMAAQIAYELWRVTRSRAVESSLSVMIN